MKKLVIVLLLLIVSCKSADNCNCKEAYFNNKVIKINNKAFNFKDYHNKSNFEYIVTNQPKKEIKKNVLLKNITKSSDNEEIIAQYYFVDGNEYNIDANTQFTNNMISGILTYYRNNTDNELYVSLLKKDETNNFVQTSIDLLKTRGISSNDILATGNNYLNINNVIVIGLVDNENMYDTNQFKEFRYALLKNVPPLCQDPCYGEGYDCLGNVCETTDDPVIICPEKKAKNKLVSENYSNFNFLNIENVLHSFRDKYLAHYKGGIQLIKFYYELPKNNNTFDINLSFSIKTIDMMNKYLPKIENLRDFPNDTHSILLNTDNKNEIIDYLNLAKTHIVDSQKLQIIDKLILFINSIENKTNYEITQSLKNRIF